MHLENTRVERTYRRTRTFFGNSGDSLEVGIVAKKWQSANKLILPTNSFASRSFLLLARFRAQTFRRTRSGGSTRSTCSRGYCHYKRRASPLLASRDSNATRVARRKCLWFGRDRRGPLFPGEVFTARARHP